MLALLLTALAVSSAPAAAAPPTVPLLTGGEVHWVGNAKRVYSGRTDDTAQGITSTQDADSAVSWDTRILVPGPYPGLVTAPAAQYYLATDWAADIGSGRATTTQTCDTPDPDCQANITPTQTCTWTERTNGPAAAFNPAAPAQLLVQSLGSDVVGTNYSCNDPLYDPSFWKDCDAVYAGQGACGTTLAFPPEPAAGDAAAMTRQFDYSASDPALCPLTDDTESCTQSGASTLTLTCALCVTEIRVQQPDLPGRTWADVPDTGTFDGNEVRLTATIHNATQHAITTPVAFDDLTAKHALTPFAGGTQPPATVTIGPGADAQVVFDWDTEGVAWQPPATADPHQIAAVTPYGGARRDVRVRPKPVLLVHGWNANASTWDGYPDRFTGVRSDWLAKAVTGMNTDPDDGWSLATNAFVLGKAISTLREEQDAEHVDLVVHSMGGLISRQYLATLAPDDPDHRPVVAHLVMLGTPNEGSRCAYVAMAAGFTGIPTQQLAPDFAVGFNQTVTNTRGTHLAVLAGIADRGPSPINELLTGLACGLQLPNDLVVWRTSAFWTLTDTAVQHGLPHTSMTSDQTAFASFVVPHLRNSASTRATVRAAGSPAAPGARAMASAASPGPSTTGAFAAAAHVRLRPRATRTVSLRVAGGRAVGAVLIAPPGVTATLLDPRGHVVAHAGSVGAFTSIAARVRRPGRWRLRLQNPTASTALAGYAVSISGDRFRLRAAARSVGRTRARVTVRVSGAGRAVRVRSTALAPASARSTRMRHVAVSVRRVSATRFVLTAPRRAGLRITIVARGGAGTRSMVVAPG